LRRSNSHGGEQPLPPYGCCCLGSINLTQFVRDPFTAQANFDFQAFKAIVPTLVRMLDNTLEQTYWPLDEQRQEAQAKRRIGGGVLGLGSMLAMLGIPYDSTDARKMAARIVRTLRDCAYEASVELAKERGSFPLFDKEQYLASPFIQRLPKRIRDKIARHGIRNSHLVSIAPTGTIALAFADNASNGIEPPFSWAYTRKKRVDDGFEEYEVADHAYRLYRSLGYDTDNLPGAFRTALQISVDDHRKMVAAIQPYVDASVSKTVNVPADYSYQDFKGVYLEAWKDGQKGLTTFRPNDTTGTVLSTSGEAKQPQDLELASANHWLRLDPPQEGAALASLRWPSRPQLPNGNMAWTYVIETTTAKIPLFVGHTDNGHTEPFEVWVNGDEAPRGLGAIAKALSMDMRAQDPSWLRAKLNSLLKVHGEPFTMQAPGGDAVPVGSAVAAFAYTVRSRIEELGYLDRSDLGSPVLDALFAAREPKTGPGGSMGWYADVTNPGTGDDFVLWIKELTVGEERRPYSIWLSGEYPRTLDGLAKVLSFDLRVHDPAWIGAKLRSLLTVPEAQGDFFAKNPVTGQSRNYPSTVAYIARLIVHRLAMLGILDEDGYPMAPHGVVDIPQQDSADQGSPMPAQGHSVAGSLCPECHTYSVVSEGGCERCSWCGFLGDCG
jgi:ribonucleoside-diphosphate reductase alpha chain